MLVKNSIIIIIIYTVHCIVMSAKYKRETKFCQPEYIHMELIQDHRIITQAKYHYRSFEVCSTTTTKTMYLYSRCRCKIMNKLFPNRN